LLLLRFLAVPGRYCGCKVAATSLFLPAVFALRVFMPLMCGLEADDGMLLLWRCAVRRCRADNRHERTPPTEVGASLCPRPCRTKACVWTYGYAHHTDNPSAHRSTLMVTMMTYRPILLYCLHSHSRLHCLHLDLPHISSISPRGVFLDAPRGVVYFALFVEITKIFIQARTGVPQSQLLNY
jgi:hypothetical protein